MSNKKKFTWGDIYWRAIRKGCDHGYAGWLANEWEERKKKDTEVEAALEAGKVDE